MSKKPAIARVAEGANQGIAAAHTPVAPGDEDLFGLELAPFEGGTIAPPKRVGRPPGSPNRSTLALQRLLLARGYRDPAEFLAAVVTMDVADLCTSIGGNKAEALALQLRAASELMPYFHQRMPAQVEIRGDAPRRMIVMGDVVNVQQIQGVGVQAPKGSHGNGSHEHGQAIEITGESVARTDD